MKDNLLMLVICCAVWQPQTLPAAPPCQGPSIHHPAAMTVRQVGRIEADRLLECSGMDVSLNDGSLFWAVNDGGHGPYLYAIGPDGRHLGRIRVSGASNRDWEGLDTFMWQGRPMILIADFGDNQQVHDRHILYAVDEPAMTVWGGQPLPMAHVSWQIAFTYPDGRHDAEGVCVDARNGRILILTKRDDPPILFELPLQPTGNGQVVTARHVAVISRIPPPTDEDRRHPHGRGLRTDMDMSPDGSVLAVLTYKHAYLFKRSDGSGWADALAAPFALIALPLPQACPALRQREAICFTGDGKRLRVTSEGRGAGIFETGWQ